jgi:hypothetical protein
MAQVTLTLPAEFASGATKHSELFSVDAVLTIVLLIFVIIGAFYLYNYFETQPQALSGCDPQASLNFPDVATYCQQYPMDQCCSVPAPPPPVAAPGATPFRRYPSEPGSVLFCSKLFEVCFSSRSLRKLFVSRAHGSTKLKKGISVIVWTPSSFHPLHVSRRFLFGTRTCGHCTKKRLGVSGQLKRLIWRETSRTGPS